jgi:organic hydroperoxide reductase OsmC/OhrA
MSVMKEMQFPVSVRWRGGKVALADAHGDELLQVATPPEFNGGTGGHWSPEDMLVAATASSFALTAAAVAQKRGVPLLDATVSATGHIAHRADGRLGFTVIELEAALETSPGNEDAVRSAARAAEKHCLISQALDVPVHLGIHVYSPALS